MADEDTNDINQPKETRGISLTPEQTAEWGNETRLSIEKRGDEPELGITIPSKRSDIEPEEIDTEVETPQIDEPDEPEAPIVTAEDPGEFVAPDVSFEVTVYDEEGKNGKAVKIASIEDWDNLLDKDPNLGSASALLKAQREATRMESKLERAQETWEEKKNDYESQVEVEQQRIDTTNQWVNEINYLIESDDLPKVATKYKNADWSDPDIAKQPGVKEQIELLNFMRNENNARKKAGLKPMTSVIDAYNAYERKSSKSQSTAQDKARGQARKVAGSRVAGVSPAPVSNVPKGISVGRAGNLNDLGNNWF